MWLPFMYKNKFYATCPDCNSDFPLREAKTFGWCPRCGEKRSGIDETMWIEYHGPLDADGLYICPRCFKSQYNGENSGYDKYKCHRCGRKLKYFQGKVRQK